MALTQDFKLTVQARAERDAGRVGKRLDLGERHPGGVDQLLAQGAEDAVPGRQDLDFLVKGLMEISHAAAPPVK